MLLQNCEINYERKSYPFQLICICQHGCSCNLWWFFSCLPIAASFPSKSPFSIYPKTQPSTYGVLTAKITGKHSGVAVIKLDSFRLNVSFDFEAHPDSYGVPGSEFTAVDITQLTVNEITDINGKSYNDFTEFEDIRNINGLLKGFIERNKLVEAEHD